MTRSMWLGLPSLLGLAAVLGFLAVYGGRGDTHAQEPPVLDHFRCYKAAGQFILEPVLLQDQFDLPFGGPKDARVIDTFRFCNPTEKLHAGVFTPIANIDNHLKLYRIVTTPNIAWNVIAANQFGDEQQLRVGQAVALAVPAQKLPHGGPSGLDHFQCYWTEGAPRNVFVGLRDQFGVAFPVQVLTPLLFCNPTLKIHSDIVTPIQNPEDHLVCYATRQRLSPVTRLVSTVDQFLAEELEVAQAHMLCVPSKKVFYEPAD